MMTLVGFASDLLDHACGNLSVELGELDRYNGGFQEYTIEAHCTRFKVNARKVDDRWEVRDWSAEDC